jgi:hypothetical protein
MRENAERARASLGILSSYFQTLCAPLLLWRESRAMARPGQLLQSGVKTLDGEEATVTFW